MKFSIGIPAFKAKFLKECISSILSQSHQDFELIIVNDASPQNLDKIVHSFNDVRIRYYKNEKNFGALNVVDNWNKCLSYATGEYFVLMGDDDIMNPDYLSVFNELINQNPTQNVFHCRSYIINEESEKTDITPVWAEYESVYDNIYHRMKNNRLQYISDFIYRSSILRKNGGFYKLPLAWGSDDISSFIAMGDKGVAHTNNPIFLYRRSSLTISNSGSIKQKLVALDLYGEWIKQFLINTPGNEKDILIRSLIEAYLPIFCKKRRIYTISPTFKGNSLRMLIYWISNRKKQGFTIPEIGYSFIEFIKSIFIN